MRHLRSSLRQAFTTSKQKGVRYHRALGQLNDRVMHLRHEFLQCQGALLAAIRHDPPRLFKEHLEDTLERLSAKRGQITRLLELTRQHRDDLQRRRGSSTDHRYDMEQREQLYTSYCQEAELLLGDIERLMTLTRYLADGGRREEAISILEEVASHYAPELTAKRPLEVSTAEPVRRSGFGFLVEAIPQSEWERYVAAPA
jgi:DNA repair exonuclease SbcCD ATPase subunit